jgi:hypothetical protein
MVFTALILINLKSFNKLLYTSPTKLYPSWMENVENTGQIKLCSQVKYGFHYASLHEIHDYSVELC